MFYVSIYTLLGIGNFVILNFLPNVLLANVLALIVSAVCFFIMYLKYVEKLGGREAAKAYHQNLLDINDKNALTIPAEVKIDDSRFKVSNSRWQFFLYVFLIHEVFTANYSNWAYIIFYIMNLAMVMMIVLPFLVESYHGLKKSGFKNFVKWSILAVLAILVLNVLNGLFLELINFEREISVNQEAIQQFLQSDFTKFAFQIVVVAPILEEILFRGIFFRKFYNKNRFLAYVITFFAFGIPHLTLGLASGAGLSEFLYLPIYGGMGVIFAYVYDKTGSVFTAMSAHLLNNLLSVLSIYFS